LGKIKMAQQEVRKQINGLEDKGATEQGLRALAKIEGPFLGVEDDIDMKLRSPIGAGSSAKPAQPQQPGGGGPQPRGGAVSGGGPGGAVSGGGPGKGRGGFVPGDDMGGEGGGGDGAYVSRQQQEQLMMDRLRAVGEEEVDLAIMQEREQHINHVAENVLVLNELFKDMANLVNDQQQAVDHIETNVESAAERTKAGIVHLEAAIEHQKACAIS
jgi:hypothetical protein